MLVIDGNGQSEIVSLFLTTSETKPAITEMIKAFKAANPSWHKVGVVITDKDFTERAVFVENFLGVSLHICLFHVLRAFRREITCEKLSLRPGERDHCLELLSKLAYCLQKMSTKSIMPVCWSLHQILSLPITLQTDIQ